MLLTSFASRAERDCGCETTRTRAECLDVKPRQFPFSAEDHRRYFVAKVTKLGDGDVILLIHDHIARIHNDEHDGRMRVLTTSVPQDTSEPVQKCLKTLRHIETRSPAGAGIANRPLVFWGFFFTFSADCLSISKGAELSQPLPCNGRGDTAL